MVKDPRFSLEIPIDASKAMEEAAASNEQPAEGSRAVKVQILSSGKALETKLVKLDAKGQGLVRFDFPDQPEAVKVLVGAASADDQELQGMERLAVPVPARQWKLKPELRLPPILIPYHHWHCWLFSCRTFTITGRVLCADGKPVPNALVTAFDMDWWWWWRSKQTVGSAYTDINGAFTIKFRWCCCWLPWWWWRRRRWLIDPRLYHAIADELRLDPHIPWPPRPMTKPDLSFFEELISGHGRPAEAPMGKAFDPSVLDALRQRLLPVLPPLKEAERLHLWPWFPWYPWHDCTPDIVFKVTQDCKVSGEVLLDEDMSDVRWNIPTHLNVTLHANDKACCLGDDDPDPAGLCAMLDGACWGSMTAIGGNEGAPPTRPAGYATNMDRPYAGTVVVNGSMGDAVDYYAFEYSTDGGATWDDLPQEAIGAFTRQFIEPGGPHPWPVTDVPVRTIQDGRLVYESRCHYEETHAPLAWGVSRYWMSVNQTALMYWLTSNTIENGTVKLRARAFTLGAGGHLVDAGVLNFCGSAEVLPLTLAIDNRKVGDGSDHPPSTDAHPCDTGSIHACTFEPETSIISIKVNGTPVNACGVIDATDAVADGPLEITFAAYDRADTSGHGHLDRFALQFIYNQGQVLTPLSPWPAPADPIDIVAGPASGSIPPADVVAGNYLQAVALGATRPNWKGGVFRLTLPSFKAFFPMTCSYSLELWAYKRNIVSCSVDQFWNRSVMTFAVKK